MQILEKGELQVAGKERESQLSSQFRDIATIVMQKTINPETQRPYTISMIERLMHEIHFAVDPSSSSKKQVGSTWLLSAPGKYLLEFHFLYYWPAIGYTANNVENVLFIYFVGTRSDSWASKAFSHQKSSNEVAIDSTSAEHLFSLGKAPRLEFHHRIKRWIWKASVCSKSNSLIWLNT